ncbi:hypothetical protein JCM19237_1819 [Photobacterium aphoticum]|uniref:Uncharacterized protein n=1 Tax=Photobacterium aphoticum TaxID=754436 RepID=A0A090QWC9_9GAMM|nr:hypothetical protein JCM19237_1819 [Photobacterium aphoticum]
MTDKVLEISGLNVSFDSTLGSKHAVKTSASISSVVKRWR